MNEVTNILTLQITMIGNANDAELLAEIENVRSEDTIREAEEVMKRYFEADDVKIISNQFFVNEKGGSNG